MERKVENQAPLLLHKIRKMQMPFNYSTSTVQCAVCIGQMIRA